LKKVERMTEYKLGFVGAGNMAEAICRAVLSNNVFSRGEVTAYDVAEERRRLFQEQFALELCSDNRTLVEHCECVLLAVKPQQIAEVLDEIRATITKEHLVISIAAGISTRYLEAGLAKPVAIIRAMPNTPLLVGSGMTGLCMGRHADDEHMGLANRIFGSAGRTIMTEESRMDAITALSGSGPAYFFYLIEAMVQAGLELGLSRHDALALSAQTALGAGKMLLETQAGPDDLRRRVTSPGGTTEAAIGVLEADQVKKILIDAVNAAAKRSKQLGR